MKKYLIFNTEQEGLQRAEAEGIASGLPYYSDNGVTRYFTRPQKISGNLYALDVTDYNLTGTEAQDFVFSITEENFTGEI